MGRRPPGISMGNAPDTYYEVVGHGEPLILISGVSSDHTAWKMTQAETFADAGFRVILFDNRDVGRTGESPVTSYTTGRMAADTIALLDRLGYGPAHVVVASLGGMIAQEVALARPDLVSTLTIVCSAARPDAYMKQVIRSWQASCEALGREDFLETRAPWLFTHRFFDRPDAVDRFRQRVRGNPYAQTAAGFVRQCDAILLHDALDRIPTIEIPTHVIVGAEDILIPPRHSKELASRIPGARLTIVPEAAHGLFWENADEFNRSVIGFIA